MAKPSILFCSNAYPPRFVGGAELIVEKHARGLRRLGLEVAIFAGDGEGNWGSHFEVRREDWNDIPVWRIQLRAEDFAHLGVSFVHRPVELQFEAMLDRFRPTVVHCHNLIGLSVQMLHLAKRRGLKTGLTLHDHWMYCPRSTMIKPNGEKCDPRCSCSCHPVLCEPDQRQLPMTLRAGMMRKIAAEVDFFHFPSKYLRDMHLLWGLPPEKCWAIPNGIEIERFSQVQRSASNSVRLTFVGYLGEHKGILLLLDAFAHTPENPRLVLNVVGEGPLRDTLASRAEQAGVADRVRFWGKIPNERIEEVYEQTDCLVLPSLWPENHPVSINEALACGIPVIGSNSGGIPELVTPNRNGYLFEQGNRAELQRILSHLACNPDCLTVLSAHAREDAQQLSLDATIRRLLGLYGPDGLPRHDQRGDLAAGNAGPAASMSARMQPNKRVAGLTRAGRSRRRPLKIACYASRFDQNTAGIIAALNAPPLRSDVQLMLAEWLYEAQLDEVDALWFAERDVPIPEIAVSRRDLLLLLPHNHVAAGCFADDPRALVYHDEDTALYILARLLVGMRRLHRRGAFRAA